MTDPSDEMLSAFDALPTMDTEAGRDAALEFLTTYGDLDTEGEYCRAAVIQEDNAMVVRFRYPDGREELFDLRVMRQMEIVRRTPDGESN